MNTIKHGFEKILTEYLFEKENSLTKNQLAIFIRKDFPYTLAEKAIVDLNKYKFTGSPGQGEWAAIPWIGIFDKDITTSAQDGYYLVYLFDENMNKFYLSLNQGWTYYKNKFGKKIGSNNIKIISKKLKKKLITLLDSKYTKLESIILGNGDLAQGYELGHICGIEYTLNSIPSDKELINDLRDMMMIYLELKKILEISNFHKIIDSLLLDDNLFIEDDIRMINEIEVAPLMEEKIEPQDKLVPRENFQGIIWPRNPKISKLALHKANYLCEYDSKHTSFISNTTKRSYMEAHHLIPINFQEEFNHNLDVSGNIICLCPNCHRKMHHAIFEEKNEIIEILFNKRKQVLEQFGLKISLEELLKKYR